MRKKIYIFLVILMAAFAACNNEPSYPPLDMGELKGQGTVDDPYNVPKAIRIAISNGEESDQFVYTAGYVVSGSIDIKYGNATFNISAKAEGGEKTLILYRIKDFDNQKFTDENKVVLGDYVVVYAPLINYKGNTQETGTGGYLYSVNGVVGNGQTN